MAVEKNYSDWLKVINENKSKSKPNDMKSENWHSFNGNIQDVWFWRCE